MRPTALALALVASLSVYPPAAPAQDLSQRLDRLRDGVVRMSFATWPDVCGDGSFIGMDVPDGFRTFRIWDQGLSISSYKFFVPDCAHGPLRLVVTKAGGQVTDLAAGVGVNWLPGITAPDWGDVSPTEAADWLLNTAARLSDNAGYVAFLAANAAEGARLTDRLSRMVRDRDLSTRVRERALSWVTVAAGRESRTAEADNLFRSVALDRTENRDLRERAIRDLRPGAASDAFLRELYGRLTETPLKERVIRRLGESDSDANVAWVRALVLDESQPVDLRDRAIRVLSDEFHRSDELKDLYPRLTSADLKDRVLRQVAETHDLAANGWLQDIAVRASEPTDARDRAIRLLAEQGVATSELVGLYDRVQQRNLRERLIRIFAERGDQAAVQKLGAIAKEDPDPDLRQQALRRLASQR